MGEGDAAAMPTFRLPARTLLYCALPRDGGGVAELGVGAALPDGRVQLSRAAVAADAGCRVCEFSLQQAVILACHPGAELPVDLACVRHLGADGWCSADGSIVSDALPAPPDCFWWGPAWAPGLGPDPRSWGRTPARRAQDMP